VAAIVMGLFSYSSGGCASASRASGRAPRWACLMLPVGDPPTEEMRSSSRGTCARSAYSLCAPGRDHPRVVLVRRRRPGIISVALPVRRPGRGCGPCAAHLHDPDGQQDQPNHIFHSPNTTLSVQIFRTRNMLSRPAGTGLGAAAHTDRDSVHFTLLPRGLSCSSREAPRYDIVDDRSEPRTTSTGSTNVRRDDEPESIQTRRREVVFEIRNCSVPTIEPGRRRRDCRRRRTQITAIIGPSGCGKTRSSAPERG